MTPLVAGTMAPENPSSLQVSRHLGSPAEALQARHGTQLLRRIASGEEAALEALHRAYADRLFSMTRHWLRDEGAAAEALQDTFLRIWRSANRYDPGRSHPFTWCVMILRGICLDHLRRGRRVPRLLDDLVPRGRIEIDPPGEDGLEDLHFHDTVQRVRTALRRLSDEERMTLDAALFDPAGNHELAERWNLSHATVKTRIHRAMSKLRQLLLQP